MNQRPQPHLSGHVAQIIDGFRNFLLFAQKTGIQGLDCSEERLGRVRDWGTRPKPVRETLDAIRRDLGDCNRCPLADHRHSIVFGAGNPTARLLFVGDGPGPEEDQRNEPFADEAGRLLTGMIHAMGLTRDQVYITYLMKCLPPKDRPVQPAEIAACRPFVRRQILTVRPECICALGAVAAQALLDSTAPITGLRGRFHLYEGIRLMPTFHPAYVLKNQARKREVWEDMQQIMGLLGLPVSSKK